MREPEDDRGRVPVWLSHALGPDTPAYKGGEGLQVARLTEIERGDTANTLRVSFPNHLGTHVDVPAHFFQGARQLLSYEAADWMYRRPVLVDVDAESGQLVESEDLGEDIPEHTDLLLLRTGHETHRGSDLYWQEGPGLSPELGFWIREEFPSVRTVGMDLISVSSQLDRPAGRAAHRAFLDPEGMGEPVRLIEDMALADCPEELAFVLASPLPLRNADGAPVTVWAFV